MVILDCLNRDADIVLESFYFEVAWPQLTVRRRIVTPRCRAHIAGLW